MRLGELHSRLKEAYDVEGWWPHESQFEVMVGAVLTQQTVWETVSKVLEVMRSRGLLDVSALARADGALEEIIRPTGFYNQKAQRLRGMARHILEHHSGDIASMLSGDLDEVRKELLSIKGIGKETADSMLLFAGDRPSFVAAAYVSRVLMRTGTFGSEDYDEVQTFVESELPTAPGPYKEFYALCVHHCKTVCLATPRCDVCHIRDRCVRRLR